MKSFQEWCELSGRRYTGTTSYEEFKKNAEDYEAYLLDPDTKGGT